MFCEEVVFFSNRFYIRLTLLRVNVIVWCQQKTHVFLLLTIYLPHKTHSQLPSRGPYHAATSLPKRQEQKSTVKPHLTTENCWSEYPVTHRCINNVKSRILVPVVVEWDGKRPPADPLNQLLPTFAFVQRAIVIYSAKEDRVTTDWRWRCDDGDQSKQTHLIWPNRLSVSDP